MQADAPITRRAGRSARPAGLQPLRRRPKQVDAEPALYEARAAWSSPGTVARAAAGRPVMSSTAAGPA